MATTDVITLLLANLLPTEINENFDLVNVESKEYEETPALHLYLEEKLIPPEMDAEALPNGFYPESIVMDFPIRKKAAVLHVRRRRWKDAQGCSIPPREIKLVAKGTRISQEFATFLKGGVR